MARAIHVGAAAIHRLDRQVYDGQWQRAGGERHWFVPNTPRGRFCLVCGHSKHNVTAHKPRPKSKRPVS